MWRYATCANQLSKFLDFYLRRTFDLETSGPKVNFLMMAKKYPKEELRSQVLCDVLVFFFKGAYLCHFSSCQEIALSLHSCCYSMYMATNCSIWLAQTLGQVSPPYSWWCFVQKMATHDVEAGKFGTNFQGIGKEQVRLGFIRRFGEGKFDEVM